MSTEIISQLIGQLQALTIALAQLATTTPAALPDAPAFQAAHTPPPYTATINIYCTTAQTQAKPISGSGVFVSPHGVILTNAHVAQYVFLSEAFPELVQCLGRVGAPAKPTYRLQTLLLPIPWVATHRFMITDPETKEKGEGDFAFLRAVALDPKQASTSTPFITPTDQYIPRPPAPVTVSGYPSGLLKGAIIARDLWPLTTGATITRLLTFGNRQVDMYELTDSLAAQKGASGSAVIDADGKLIGLVTTADLRKATLSKRTFRALSIIHISNQLRRLRGVPITLFLTQDPALLRARFLQQDAAILQALYQEVLQ